MTGKRIGYKRVSTDEQNPARQLEGMEFDKTFVEYASGKSTDRPQLRLMLDYVREDDIVFVHTMDRLARNVRDLCQLVDGLIAKGVEVRFVTQSLTFDGRNDAISRMMLFVMGAIAEFELAVIKERQLEGIRIAQAAGKYKGRRKVLDAIKIEKLKNDYYTTRKTFTEMAAELGVSRATVNHYLGRMPARNGDTNRDISSICSSGDDPGDSVQG